MSLPLHLPLQQFGHSIVVRLLLLRPLDHLLLVHFGLLVDVLDVPACKHKDSIERSTDNFTFLRLVDLALAALAQVANEAAERVPNGRVHVHVALVFDVLLVDVVGSNALAAEREAEDLKPRNINRKLWKTLTCMKFPSKSRLNSRRYEP